MKIISLQALPDESISHNPEIKKRVILRKGDVPYLTNFSQARFAAGQSAPAHSHENMYEFFLVESGEGIININNRKHKLNKGIFVVVEPTEVHEIFNNNYSELVLTYFGICT